MIVVQSVKAQKKDNIYKLRSHITATNRNFTRALLKPI